MGTLAVRPFVPPYVCSRSPFLFSFKVTFGKPVLSQKSTGGEEAGTALKEGW